MRYQRLPALILLLSLIACTGVTPGHAPAAATRMGPSETASVPADDNLDATLWTQRAAEHDFAYLEIYRNAKEKLLSALDDPTWDALPREDRDADQAVADLPPAVILDVDDAVLDNSPYQARLIHSGEEYGEFTWAQWCREELAKALPGAVEFTQFAVRHGIGVYYITNRAQDLDEVTLANLRKVGLPVMNDSVFLGLGTVVEGCEQFGTDKGCRRRLVGRTHRVLMQFGDQLGDFVDIVANTPEHRADAMKPYLGWIGERWWVLPNPTYGSWVPATFNNDWTQSREQRRKAKIDALRVN